MRITPILHAKLLFFVAFLLTGRQSTAQISGPGPRVEVDHVHLGSTIVDLLSHQGVEGRLRFVNLHDNENTSVEAAVPILWETGGEMLEIRHTGRRNVKFVLGGKTYEFDPNRIFSAAGVMNTLVKNGGTSSAAEKIVFDFGRHILGEIKADSLHPVVALHNNTEAEYSILTYQPGADYAADAASVHVVPERDPDDFFFVTYRPHFELLSAGGFNVVLQNNTEVTDDGSLSVYCGMHGIPYVNVEAQQGHLREQRQMLAFLVKVLNADDP